MHAGCELSNDQQHIIVAVMLVSRLLLADTKLLVEPSCAKEMRIQQ